MLKVAYINSDDFKEVKQKRTPLFKDQNFIKDLKLKILATNNKRIKKAAASTTA